jgi:hypothetical protein
MEMYALLPLAIAALLFFLFATYKARDRLRVAAFATLALVIMMVVPILREMIGWCQAWQAAQHFYSHLAADDFESAFDYVAYYDKYSDVPPEMPEEKAQHVWVNRVSRMAVEGIYLSRVKRIKVLLDDGSPKGRAYVTIWDQGVEREIVQDVHFAKPGTWKVQDVASMSGELSEFSQAISGMVSMD